MAVIFTYRTFCLEKCLAVGFIVGGLLDIAIEILLEYMALVCLIALQHDHLGRDHSTSFILNAPKIPTRH